MIQGRPIRFLVTVMGGWTMMRVVLLWPVPPNLLVPHALIALQSGMRGLPHADRVGLARLPPRGGNMDRLPTGLARATGAGADRGKMAAAFPVEPRPVMGTAGRPAASNGGWSSAIADRLLEAQMAFIHTPRPPLALAGFAPGQGLSPGELGVPAHHEGRSDRWLGSAWLLWRPDSDRGAVPSPRLGGAQAGVRVDYLLAPSSRIRPTLYGRLSSALHGIAAAEVATGIAIRPRLPFPVIVAVERRQALSPGGRSDFAVLAAGGVNPMEVGHGFRLDGYGQAGMVGVDRRDAFADGRLTLEHPLDGAGGVVGRNVAIGAAVWGGAQPGVSRLDVGPQASVRVRLGGATMRLGAEWRAQVAGNAAPSSGPAFSLGADF